MDRITIPDYGQAMCSITYGGNDALVFDSGRKSDSANLKDKLRFQDVKECSFIISHLVISKT